MNGTDLLANFKEKRSEAAFSELVRRYTNLVYSVALRRLSNVSLTEEVTQLVFIRLARAAPNLGSDAHLVAWLHRTTVHISIDLWRAETRRRAREEHAVAMQSNSADDIAWNELSPVVDEALNELTDADRQAILLRFFEQKSMRDLGAAVGVSEDAAKMRVSRAMERLRSQLEARGLACSAVALTSLLTERSVEAAPSAFAAALASFSFPIAAGVGTAGGFFASVAQVSKMKTLGGIAATVLVGVTAFFLVQSRTKSPFTPALSQLSASAETQDTSQKQGAESANQVLDPNGTEGREPDPLKLLERIASVRRRMASGSMEFHVSVDQFENGRKETDHLRLNALFDGQKHRMESFKREYRYASEEASIQAQGLDRAAAVRAGLLQPFEAHYVTTYDGASLLMYSETDGKQGDTSIADVNDGNGSFIFDPRCLGLRTFLSAESTIDNCLGHLDAKSISLVGREFVEGDPSWHVRVQRKVGDTLDFWIAVAKPDRVLKHAYGKDVVLSKYDAADPIPTDVKAMEYHKGSPLFYTQFVRSNANFNLKIDPASWTLAGLGMKIGTDVSDNRNMRRIGYWNGSGLSENIPDKGGQPQSAPNLEELLAILDNEAASELGLQTASWILLNTPDGPAVEKAADVILRNHVQSPNLAQLCSEMERLRHRCSKKLLQDILDQNPNTEVQVTACFTLATLLKDEAKFGKNKQATAEADKLFQRVATEFARAGKSGSDFARRAKRELSELRRLSIGKVAPDFEGKGFDGERIRLHDFRGKVVVVIFWTVSTAEIGDETRKLVERMADKPVAFLGVNCDKDLDRAKSTAEKRHITFPTIWDGRSGPIFTDWHIGWWPNIFVLDRKGVIRYRDVRDGLEGAVETLLRE